MQTSTISERHQTAIPAALCRKYGLKPRMKLLWLDTGNGIRIVPVPEDPVKAIRGFLKGLPLTEILLRERREERERERRKSER
jgi:bifunctional DNA-binding transcriptional regulator/antitoxin component of YhaV-PrlF toxin-antitoxin module